MSYGDAYEYPEPDETDFMTAEVAAAMRTAPFGDIRPERTYADLAETLRARVAEGLAETRSEALRDALVEISAMAAVFAIVIDIRDSAEAQLSVDEQRSMRRSATDLVGPVTNLPLPADTLSAADLVRKIREL